MTHKLTGHMNERLRRLFLSNRLLYGGEDPSGSTSVLLRLVLKVSIPARSSFWGQRQNVRVACGIFQSVCVVQRVALMIKYVNDVSCVDLNNTLSSQALILVIGQWRKQVGMIQ